VRFHPFNRVTTALIDMSALALLGFPPWALLANNLIRHYYGLFIHTDLPWTYGPLGRVFVSPAMHRWHHIRDADGAGANFATVFAVFDQAFHTFHLPGPCTVPLGVRDDVGRGALAQLLWPFKALFLYLRHPGAREARTRDPGANAQLYDPLVSGSRSAHPE
jgi:sterol desaturase/sphingolipid hydroxylase (fatty acid hydroxylase superfamily)